MNPGWKLFRPHPERLKTLCRGGFLLSTEKNKVLLVDDDQMLRELLAGLLSDNGYAVEEAANGLEALDQVESRHYDHVITDINMPKMDGLSFLKEIREKGIKLNITVLSAHSDMSTVVEAMKLGASDFIAKPFQSEDEILLTLKKVEERDRLERENVRLRKEVEEKYTFSNIVAKSRKMTEIFKLISKIADYKTTVLIIGESGTGKELIAKAIHYNSNRKKQPLISVNCGGIPETLLESELFGHVKGAFTDAYRGKKGLFEEADGGTLFLDEVGDVPLSLQVKLLRLLETGTYRRVGSVAPREANFRLITATHRDLQTMVTAGSFRRDLFYRISTFPIALPALKERSEDLPLLIESLLSRLSPERAYRVTAATLACLQEYTFPGNIRELRNILERAILLADDNVLLPEHLTTEACDSEAPSRDRQLLDSGEILPLREIERRYLMQVVSRFPGDRDSLADKLGISKRTLFRKLQQLRTR